VTQAYTNYIAGVGNVLLVAKTNLSKNLTDAFKVHYKSEPKSFDFIGKLRDSSPAVCPMCGSLNTGTLDHLFPQEHFPEYAVLSKNLVPACDCNTKRKDIYKGVDADGNQLRVLHPYFDSCFLNRLIYYRILPKDVYPVAEFSLQYINTAHLLHQSIKFHVEKIVLPSGIQSRIENMWSSLVEYPSDQIRTLPENEEIDLVILINALQSALRRHDRQKGSPNNWDSLFVYSILQSPSAITFIVAQHNRVIRDNRLVV
jgi:hypothetical protein